MKKSYCKSVSDLWNTYDFSKIIITGIVLGLALAFLDYYDTPSQLINSIPNKVVWAMLGGVVIIVSVWLLENHYFDLFHIAATNPVDVISMVIIAASVVYIPIRWWLIEFALYTEIALYLSGALSLFLLVRIGVRSRKYATAESRSSNLVDLKDLYDNKISRIPEMPILIRENDVDYDLFNRSEIVNRLYRSIVHCRPEASYVISLEGEWGCGKTTIINNVIRLLETAPEENQNIVVIDDFDPWLFGSQEALLLGMYDTLLQHVGLRYSPTRTNWIVNGIAQVVSENHAAGGLIYNLLHNENKSSADIQVLKQRISAYLQTSNKRIVFFVDNLDRANDENIIFLFKLISIVFDLPGVVYVLSFERERINTILKETREIDQRFTEKIIQQEIKVPTIGEETSNDVYSLCIYNLLEAYGISGQEIMELAPVLKYIINQTQNIRMFKRILNSVFPAVFCYEGILNKSDLLAIEAIHFFDPELYTKIHQNPRFFVSHEKTAYDSFMTGLDKKKFNEEGSEFFRDLLGKHNASKEVLKSMFPYVERHLQGTALEHDTNFSDPRSSEIAKQSRICSGKYFDLYFSHNSNEFLEIRKKVEQFIREGNFAGSISHGISVMRKALDVLPDDDHTEWVEQLQSHIVDILPEKAYYFASAMYAAIYDFSGNEEFLALTPQSRAEYILSELLTRCSEQEFDEFMEIVQADYRKLKVIRSILYWLNSNSIKNQEHARTRAELLTKKFNAMCEKILTDNLCIYADDNYHRGNAWTLYHYCKEKEDIPRFTRYIMGNMSPATIYRILWDISTVAIGRNYSYSITAENMKVFCDNEALLAELIQSTPPRTTDEEFVNSIYMSYVNGVTDVWGHAGVVTSKPKKLTL